jgi:curved DNA-binding protein CbpA
MDDPFDALGLPASFDLAPTLIERAYLSRAASVHPDLSEEDPEQAVRAAAINRARVVLLNPEQRADALLRRLGGPAKEQDKSLPTGFLASIMELREEVEAEAASGDALRIAARREWARLQGSEYASRVGSLFQNLGTPPEPVALTEIRRELNAWRYIERLIEQLDPKYDPARADIDDPGRA